MTTATDVRSVAERLDQEPPKDATRFHVAIANGMQKLADRLYAAFPVKEHASAAPYREYKSPDGSMSGVINVKVGSPIDWSVASHIAALKRGFCNHHLTTYLDATVRVPHLAFAMGTIPELFFYCDLVPRSDPWTNVEELDRYHARFNDRSLRLATDARFRPFVSREIYIRGALSPIGICIQGEANEANIAACLAMADETMGPWIEWVKTAERVPQGERAALARRDDLVRRTICWRDPANVVAERVFGKEMTDELVRVLSAESRGPSAFAQSAGEMS